MKVFLDTNVFYNNWFANSPNFNVLFYFLNNKNYELLLSDLVTQEVNNIINRERNEIKSQLIGLVKKGNKLNKNIIKFSPGSLGFESYDLTNILNIKIDWINNISYEGIPHRTVVDRAIKMVKPFNDQEKGYRDTLIWLSFLRYIKEKNIEGDIVFITNNKHDFFEIKEKSLTFNDDLARDIKEHEIKANIRPYLNIYDFLNEIADKASHSFNRHEILDDLEDFLIRGTEAHLNNMNNSEIGYFLGTKVFSEKLTSVIDIKSEVFEGLESPKVKDVKSLPKNSVYISSSFEMRRVILVITIEKVEFKQHVDEIESIGALYNIDINGDYVELSFVIRAHIECSFEYETKDKLASNFSIENIS